MLLELLNHSIDEKLAHCIQHGQRSNIHRESFILKQEFEDVGHPVWGQGKHHADDSCVLVDVVIHFDHRGLILGFDLGLKIRQKAISNPGNNQIKSAQG